MKLTENMNNLTKKQIENSARQAKFGFYRAIVGDAERGQDLRELKEVTDRFNEYVDAFPGFITERANKNVLPKSRERYVSASPVPTGYVPNSGKWIDMISDL